MHTSTDNARDNPLVQAICASILARNVGKSAALFAAERYGAQSLSFRALAASTGAAGGFLIPAGLGAEVIDTLRAHTVLRRHTPRENIIGMDHGDITLGRADTAATVGFIGESETADLPAAMQWGAVSMSSKKAFAGIPISNSLLRYGAHDLETVVSQQLLRAYGVAEDAAFLTGIGNQFTPQGIRWRANTVATATLSYSAATIISDLNVIVAALEDASVPMKAPLWVTSPKVKRALETTVSSSGQFLFPELSAGRLFKWPLESTTSIAVNQGTDSNLSELYLIDMGEFYIGQSFAETQSLSSATYTDANGVRQSCFDRDETLVRLVAGVDSTLAHKEAAAVLTAVPWGN